MKFKVDENVPHRAAELIRQRGHDVLTLLDQMPPGLPDPRIVEMVSREGRFLNLLDHERLAGCLWIVGVDRVRIRGCFI